MARRYLSVAEMRELARPPAPARITTGPVRGLEGSGGPMCPKCGERDRVKKLAGGAFCDRCMVFLAALGKAERRYEF